MKISRNSHCYVVRYRDSKGAIHQESVYALDAMEAQNLAMELNDELTRRPHRIMAILLNY